VTERQPRALLFAALGFLQLRHRNYTAARRRHSSLDYLSPIAYETRALSPV
jgi:hypothetical protein